MVIFGILVLNIYIYIHTILEIDTDFGVPNFCLRSRYKALFPCNDLLKSVFFTSFWVALDSMLYVIGHILTT